MYKHIINFIRILLQRSVHRELRITCIFAGRTRNMRSDEGRRVRGSRGLDLRTARKRGWCDSRSGESAMCNARVIKGSQVYDEEYRGRNDRDSVVYVSPTVYSSSSGKHTVHGFASDPPPSTIIERVRILSFSRGEERTLADDVIRARV